MEFSDADELDQVWPLKKISVVLFGLVSWEEIFL
jgi:hypothetical protein